jgi:hypothetical protein
MGRTSKKTDEEKKREIAKVFKTLESQKAVKPLIKSLSQVLS